MIVKNSVFDDTVNDRITTIGNYIDIEDAWNAKQMKQAQVKEVGITWFGSLVDSDLLLIITRS